MLGGNWERGGSHPKFGQVGSAPVWLEVEEDECSTRLTPQREPGPIKSPQPQCAKLLS